MDIFVEDGLEIVLGAESQHAMPVAIVVALAQQCDGIVLVEQGAKSPSDQARGVE